MITPILVSLCLSAAGLKTSTPLEEVKLLDARLPEFLKEGPALTAALASKPELKQVLTAMKVNKSDFEVIMNSMIAEQKPAADLPAAFTPTSVIVTTPEAGKMQTFHFYDGKSRLDVGVMRRANKTMVLLGAPQHAAENELEGDLILRRSSGEKKELDVSYFVKEGGAWKAGPLPAVTQEQCLERLRAPARALAESQARYLKANKTYAKSISDLDYDGSKFTVVATVKSGSATKYLAKISMYGAEVTIDESGKPVDAKPCELAP